MLTLATVLVVEDDAAHRAVLRAACRGVGLGVREAATGADAVDAIAERPPDLVLLDVSLPDVSGLEVCRRVRATGVTTPIIMVSGHADVIDVVVGMEVGADDYVRKPYRVRELLARIAAHLRRVRKSVPGPEGRLDFPDLSIDLGAHRVELDGVEVRLSVTEFKVLALLASRSGATVTRADLVDAVWGGTLAHDSRAIDVHIHRVRRKLEGGAGQRRYIETVSGVGYRFAQPPAQTAAGAVARRDAVPSMRLAGTPA